MFNIFPAIDLKDGMAVRLYKGDMAQSTIYGNPLDFAKKFQEYGARWIHIVDLNGACSGSPKNFEIIKQITKTTQINIQIGGGIRNEDSIKKYLDLGVSRIILGSIATQDFDFTQKMAEKYPIVIGIDAKDHQVAINGWKEVQNINAFEFASKFANTAIEAIICTDISRDGALSGINIDFSIKMAQASKKPCIASGGFKDLNNLIELKESFKSHHIEGGVIVGKAFYENKINLTELFTN